MKYLRIQFAKVEKWKHYKIALDNDDVVVHDNKPYDVHSIKYDSQRDRVVVCLVPHYEDSGGPGSMDAPIEGM